MLASSLIDGLAEVNALVCARLICVPLRWTPRRDSPLGILKIRRVFPREPGSIDCDRSRWLHYVSTVGEVALRDKLPIFMEPDCFVRLVERICPRAGKGSTKIVPIACVCEA